ncbi:MAG: endolytic transglycosylase MltG [bacterium]
MGQQSGSAAVEKGRLFLRRLIVIPVLGMMLAAYVATFPGYPVNPSDSVALTVAIPAGAGTGQIARLLEQNRLIKSSIYFRGLARLRGLDGKLQAGEYNLSRDMSAAQILQKLVQGEVVAYPVTFPEGYTVQQIAAKLEEAGFTTAESFLAAARDDSVAPPYPNPKSGVKDSMEGYLFPDTYHLPRTIDNQAIVEILLNRFRSVMTPEWERRAAELGYTIPEIITIASMVEGEAKVPEERGVIAGVIYNRLRAGMRLQIDATVLYALPERKTVVLTSDLEVDSPYNTYRNPGLPPGPINNPGKEAIYAALYPEETPYFYYVARKDGSHVFSRTLAEHNKARAQVRAE